jgi:hypothetical protein
MILNEVNAFLKEILEIDDIPLELYQKVYDSIIQNIPKEQILVTDLNKINDYVYSLIGKSKFLVNEKFPKLSRKNLSKSIVSASYELNIETIKEFEVNL